MEPNLPNGRLNPNFVTLATRRAQGLAFEKVREREARIALDPTDQFHHKNHYNFMNKVMVDIEESRKEVAERFQTNWEKQKAAVGFGNEFNSYRIDPVPNKLQGSSGIKARPKTFYNTTSLFECLWDTTEPKGSPKQKKYGATKSKVLSSGDRNPGRQTISARRGSTAVFDKTWTPGSVVAAHEIYDDTLDLDLPLLVA
jgi:hypothetical protein